MTNQEAYISLKSRVEWRKPLDDAFFFLSNKTPESGRFLQEEHSAVRIPVIHETLFDIDISEENFIKELEYLKEKAILQMLHDVFYDQKEIPSECIKDNESLFDYAIILKNTSNVLFDLLNSSRVNLTETITSQNLKRWFIDLNGMKDTVNGIYTQGFIDRYRREIERIRKVLFIKRKPFKVVTAK